MNVEAIVGLTLHVGVPLVGLASYILLYRKMGFRNLAMPLFLLFFVYGGWLLIGLTSLFWKWSGMASLGMFFLLFLAPIILGLQAFSLRGKIEESSSHTIIYRMSFAYPCLLGAILLGCFVGGVFA